MNTKKAGVERPYTYSEFLRIVEELAKEQNIEFLDHLDYFIVSILDKDKTIVNRDDDVISITTYGVSEGIYSDFYFRYNGKDTHFATAKTLFEGKEAFVQMNVMAAKICLVARDYIISHGEEFHWPDLAC